MIPHSQTHNDQWDVDTKTLLRPVTVRQILEAKQDHSDADFTIDGYEITNVTVVAHIVSVNSDATKYNLYLEDGTRGQICAEKWRSDNQAENVDVIPHIYVRIVGKIKRFKGHNYIEVSNIREIVDYHELCFHLLDAVVTTLTYERGPPPPNSFLSQSSVPMDGQAHCSPASLTQFQDVFDTSFAMHAMHDSLRASPKPEAIPVFSPPSLSQHTGNTQDMNNDIKSSLGEDDSSNLLLKEDKGKERADPLIHQPGHMSPVLLFNSTAGTSQPSTSSKTQRDLSSTDTSNTFTERKLDPYSDVNILGRRIILIMFESEQRSPIYPMAEVDTRYQGVDVGTIMNRLYSLDSSITPEDVDEQITFLLSEGYIYTTVDDYHVRLTQAH